MIVHTNRETTVNGNVAKLGEMDSGPIRRYAAAVGRDHEHVDRIVAKPDYSGSDFSVFLSTGQKGRFPVPDGFEIVDVFICSSGSVAVRVREVGV